MCADAALASLAHTSLAAAPSTRVHGPTDLGSLRTSTVCVTVPGRFERAAEFAGTVLSASFDEIGDTALLLNMPARQLWVDHMLESNRCAAILGDRATLNRLALANCASRELLSLHLAPIQWGFVGLPARRETLANLSTAMSEYASSPAFVEVRSRYFGDGEVCAEEAPETTPIRAQMMAGVYIIFVGTCALAILVALIQRGCCPGPSEHRGNPYGGATDGEILRTLLAKVDALAAASEGVRVDSDHMSLGTEPLDSARGVGPKPRLLRMLSQPLSMVRIGPIVNAKKLMLGGGLVSKQMRSMDVTLMRRTPDEALGLGVGYDGPNSTFLLSIKPGSPAERCGALKLSDEIMAVNGTKLSSRVDFPKLLASAGMFVTLTILRPEDASPGAKSYAKSGATAEAAAMREIQVTLVKRNPQESLGLGVGFNASGATVLASMKPGSPAERCAALQLNDQIVAVGGQPISADTDFKTLLASTPIANLKVTLTILRPEDASPGAKSYAKSGATAEAAAMREIQVTLVKRNPQESLGLGVGFNASGATVLASMKPGSPAERCAALQLNDQIVAVGGQPISADTDFKTLLASTPIANLKVTLTILRGAKSSGFVDDGGTLNVQKRYLLASENSIPEGFEGSPERAHMPANLIDTDVVQRGAPTPGQSRQAIRPQSTRAPSSDSAAPPQAHPPVVRPPVQHTQSFPTRPSKPIERQPSGFKGADLYSSSIESSVKAAEAEGYSVVISNKLSGGGPAAGRRPGLTGSVSFDRGGGKPTGTAAGGTASPRQTWT